MSECTRCEEGREASYCPECFDSVCALAEALAKSVEGDVPHSTKCENEGPGKHCPSKCRMEIKCKALAEYRAAFPVPVPRGQERMEDV